MFYTARRPPLFGLVRGFPVRLSAGGLENLRLNGFDDACFSVSPRLNRGFPLPFSSERGCLGFVSPRLNRGFPRASRPSLGFVSPRVNVGFPRLNGFEEVLFF
jgi:hypothetical protein